MRAAPRPAQAATHQRAWAAVAVEPVSARVVESDAVGVGHRGLRLLMSPPTGAFQQARAGSVKLTASVRGSKRHKLLDATDQSAYV
jgi:hypothetical protein